MHILDACSDASFAQTMLFIKKLVDIIFIIAPVLLILVLTIDFTKAVMANDNNRIKQVKNSAIKRVLFAILLLFVPLIVDTSFGLLSDSKSKIIKCYSEVTESKVNSLVEKANQEAKKKEKEEQKDIKANKTKQKSEADKRKKNAKSAAERSPKNSSSSGGVSIDNVCTSCSGSEKIAQLAEAMAWPYGTKDSVYHHNYSSSEFSRFNSWSDLTRAKPTKGFMEAYDKVRPKHGFKGKTSVGADCGTFAIAVVKAAGYGKGMGWTQYEDYFRSSSNWKEVKGSEAKRGDMCRSSGGGFHAYVYLGKNRIAQASHHAQNFGHIAKGNCDGDYAFRAL